MYFLLFLFIIVIIYTMFRKRKENFEFKSKIIDIPEIDKLEIYSQNMFNNDEKDNLIRTLGQDIFSAYKLLKIDSMKNDLWSYCLIYKNGGVFIDEKLELIGDKSIFNKDGLIVVPELNENLFSNSVFSSPKPNNPILKNIIELSVNRIINNEIVKEEMIEYITGKQCFTDGIQQYLSENNKKYYADINNYVKYKSRDITTLEPLNFYKNIVRPI
jgi:mannosyltransferase OCH1-like enzyme